MAPKKASRLPNNSPPPPEPEKDPSEEIEVEEESEEEDFEEESEVGEKEDDKAKTPLVQPSQVGKKPSLQKRTTLLSSASESDGEGGSESEEGEGEEWEESDYPSSPNASDFTIKPISPKKPAPKDSKPAMKRPSETQKDEEKDSRSRKKAKTNDEEEKKNKSSYAVSAPGAVGRIWSEDDEIAVLQGMIDYQKKKGADPSNDMVAFHGFVKGKLYADISKNQLYDKVRRFKKKFLANVEKAESGEDPVFSKTHEYKAFDLSKRIWGCGSKSSGSDDNANAKSNKGKVKRGGKIGSIVKEVEKKDVAKDNLGADTGDFLSKYPNLSESFAPTSSSFLLPDGVKISLEDSLSLIGSVKAAELEDKWKKLREEETEIFLKKMNLVSEQTKLFLEARKKR